jgi:hypothetical protein
MVAERMAPFGGAVRTSRADGGAGDGAVVERVWVHGPGVDADAVAGGAGLSKAPHFVIDGYGVTGRFGRMGRYFPIRIHSDAAGFDL